jgi:hypothetical protein
MVGRFRSGQARQEIDQATQIVIAKMGAARADNDRGIVGRNVGPLHRQARELACVVVEVDPVLAPRLPAIDQTKRSPMQWMERMRDTKRLCGIARRRCN